ncbi:hypothetical protein KNT87_gp117 [Erwinia phage Cronus]|uniref:Uncharacterized protein n=1 Tax=Erwinia phage Cronus TaxID=2163633 RepID=A0A2S1GME9_9CAUD|nr:hypothetical protein KNT87_gp117 [Erwinia phage Cronus]AWD90556.1 hypothetical protein [Erwinia phage Cronus]
MASAVYIKWENSDSRLFCFDDAENEFSADLIKSELREMIDYNGPIADFSIEVSKNESEDVKSFLFDVMEDVADLSWKNR